MNAPRGKVLTRLMLMEAAREYDFELCGNIIDMHLRRLRQKVDYGFAQQLIQLQMRSGRRIHDP